MLGEVTRVVQEIDVSWWVFGLLCVWLFGKFISWLDVYARREGWRR
jgi:hypothetical protein